MGRGPVVAKKKEISNAAKQKIFTIHAKLISIAAGKGGDPALNPSLHDAIENAKKDNLPNDNIERAIKKGTGEDKDSSKIEQIVYEGYGTGGVAFMVSTLTDNKNRTASNIRHIFTRYAGSMGESGSVSYMFERDGIIIINLDKYKKDLLEEIVFETQAKDFFDEDGMFKVITSLEDFLDTKKIFESKNINFEFADIDFIPTNIVDITDFDKALKLTKMIDDFNNDDDVEKISANLNIDEKLQKEVNDFIEKNTFRT